MGVSRRSTSCSATAPAGSPGRVSATSDQAAGHGQPEYGTVGTGPHRAVAHRQRGRVMARTRGVVVVTVVLVVAVAFGAFPAGTAVAQSQASKDDEMLLAPDGVADLRVLPQQALDAQAGVGNIHRHFPDPEALLERKAGLLARGGGGG